MNTEYQIYLKSKKWKDFKKSIILERGFKCEECTKVPDIDKGELLHLHHLTYHRLYNEEKVDVKLLCPRCHMIAHGKMKVSLPTKYHKKRKSNYDSSKDESLKYLKSLIDSNDYYFYIFSSNSIKLNESIDYGFNLFKGKNLIHSDIFECSDNDYNTQNKGELLAFLKAIEYIEENIGIDSFVNVFTSNQFIPKYPLNAGWKNKNGFQVWYDVWERCHEKLNEYVVRANFIRKHVAKDYLV